MTFRPGITSSCRPLRLRSATVALIMSTRRVRRSVQRPRRQSTPDCDERKTAFPPSGAFGAIEPDINSPRVQSWNVDRRAADWDRLGRSASYLGNYSDRLWDWSAQSGGLLGTGPCTLNGVFYPVCSTTANTNESARHLAGESKEGSAHRHCGSSTTSARQTYRGLQLSVPAPLRQRRELQRQLHLVVLLRRSDGRRNQPDSRPARSIPTTWSSIAAIAPRTGPTSPT